MKFLVLAVLALGVNAGDSVSSGTLKLKTSYPATRNVIGNLYETKRPHDLYKVEPAYTAAAPFHDRLEAASYAPGYGYQAGYGHGYGYGPSFNKGREVAYSHGDLIYPDRLYGHAVDGDHDRYYRYPGLAYKNYYGYAKDNGYGWNYGYAKDHGYGLNWGYAGNDWNNHGYAADSYGYNKYADHSAYY